MTDIALAKFPEVEEIPPQVCEADLIRSAQNGNLEAFNQLVLFYQDQIFGLAGYILGDGEAAQDVTQDTFLAAYRSLSSFRGGSFRSWLGRIATHRCYDELRRQKRRPVITLDGGDRNERERQALEVIPAPGLTPEQSYERHELEEAIQFALNQLEPNQRAVVVLVDLQEYEYQEAAHILSIPVGTVKSRLARGRVRFYICLRDLLRI